MWLKNDSLSDEPGCQIPETINPLHHHVVAQVTRYLNILAANPNDQATADAVFTEGKAELEALIAEEEARGRRDGPWAFM